MLYVSILSTNNETWYTLGEDLFHGQIYLKVSKIIYKSWDTFIKSVFFFESYKEVFFLSVHKYIEEMLIPLKTNLHNINTELKNIHYFNQHWIAVSDKMPSAIQLKGSRNENSNFYEQNSKSAIFQFKLSMLCVDLSLLIEFLFFGAEICSSPFVGDIGFLFEFVWRCITGYIINFVMGLATKSNIARFLLVVANVCKFPEHFHAISNTQVRTWSSTASVNQESE